MNEHGPVPEMTFLREKSFLHTPIIVTIGVYGFTEVDFFHALRQAGVDTFVDIRGRRGVRGCATPRTWFEMDCFCAGFSLLLHYRADLYSKPYARLKCGQPLKPTLQKSMNKR